MISATKNKDKLNSHHDKSQLNKRKERQAFNKTKCKATIPVVLPTEPKTEKRKKDTDG